MKAVQEAQECQEAQVDLEFKQLVNFRKHFVVEFVRLLAGLGPESQEASGQGQEGEEEGSGEGKEEGIQAGGEG